MNDLVSANNKMSAPSVTSSKPESLEKTKSDLIQELESVRALNTTLRKYLDHIKTFKKDLVATHKNFKQLQITNTQWVDMLSKIK